MKANVERLSDNQVKLTIDLDAKEFQGAIKKAFENVVKDVKIDGFRQGKVPFNIYITRFGYESLYEEAINVTINEYYPKAVVENNVLVVDSPKIDFDYTTLSHDGPFTFTATVDVVPIVHLGEYLNTKVTALSKVVSEADIDQDIRNTLKQKAENMIKEEPIALGDTAVIDFEGFLGDEAFEGGKAENYPLEVGSKTFIPGFEEQLVGLKSGDAKDVVVTFPENYQAENLAGKEVTFKVVVHEVKTKVVPDLTDEIVAELNIENVKTVAEYKEHVKATLEEEKATKYENHIVEQVIKAACDNARIDIPESMIDQEFERRMEDLENQAKQYKIPVELFLQYNGYELEQFKTELRTACVHRVFEQLVLDEIAHQEKIEVTDDELNAEFQKLAETNKIDVETIKERVDSVLLSEHVRTQKTIQLLKDKAIIE